MAKQIIEGFNRSRTERIADDTGALVKPEDTLTDQEAFAHPVEERSETICEGVIFSQRTEQLDGTGAFTNRYTISCAPDASLDFEVATSATPIHLQRYLRNDSHVQAVINGGFFFLADGSPECPRETAFGTIVRDGVVHGLQSSDRPLLYVHADGLHARNVRACGILRTNAQEYAWVGAGVSSEDRGVIRLYNPSNCKIIHVHDPVTGVKRVLDAEHSKTDEDSAYLDVVCEHTDAGLVVTHIVRGGGTSVLGGNFILQGTKMTVGGLREGECITPYSIDDLLLKDVRSAMTTGPAVSDFAQQNIGSMYHDASLGDRAPFEDRRMARSVVYQTDDGTTYLEVFDGAPKTALFKGVTPHEVAPLIFSEHSIVWAYHMDPGQSARMEVRHSDDSLAGYGNTHYVRWPHRVDHPYVWAGEHGRAVSSALVIKSI